MASLNLPWDSVFLLAQLWVLGNSKGKFWSIIDMEPWACLLSGVECVSTDLPKIKLLGKKMPVVNIAYMSNFTT